MQLSPNLHRDVHLNFILSPFVNKRLQNPKVLFVRKNFWSEAESNKLLSEKGRQERDCLKTPKHKK